MHGPSAVQFMKSKTRVWHPINLQIKLGISCERWNLQSPFRLCKSRFTENPKNIPTWGEAQRRRGLGSHVNCANWYGWQASSSQVNSHIWSKTFATFLLSPKSQNLANCCYRPRKKYIQTHDGCWWPRPNSLFVEPAARRPNFLCSPIRNRFFSGWDILSY